MPLCCWRSRPAWPPELEGRRPRRRLFLPPPPEGCPGPTFINFSFCSVCFQSARRGTRFRSPCAAALRLVPRFAHLRGACSRNPVRLELTRECSVSVLAPGATGRGGPAREHGRWEHDDVTAPGGGNASRKSSSFAQK